MLGRSSAGTLATCVSYQRSNRKSSTSARASLEATRSTAGASRVKGMSARDIEMSEM